MPQKVIVATLLSDYAVGSNSNVVTGIIDMREYARAESLFIRATSVLGSVNYKLEWVGGITDSEFQEWDVNEDMLAGITAETWQIVYPPDFKAPFVKFKVTTTAGAHADTLVTLRAYLREDFAG
jgi:hypothetical protein